MRRSVYESARAAGGTGLLPFRIQLDALRARVLQRFIPFWRDHTATRDSRRRPWTGFLSFWMESVPGHTAALVTSLHTARLSACNIPSHWKTLIGAFQKLKCTGRLVDGAPSYGWWQGPEAEDRWISILEAPTAALRRRLWTTTYRVERAGARLALHSCWRPYAEGLDLERAFSSIAQPHVDRTQADSVWRLLHGVMIIPRGFRGAAPPQCLACGRGTRVDSAHILTCPAHGEVLDWLRGVARGLAAPATPRWTVATLLGGEELTENGSPGSWHPLRILRSSCPLNTMPTLVDTDTENVALFDDFMDENTPSRHLSGTYFCNSSRLEKNT